MSKEDGPVYLGILLGFAISSLGPNSDGVFTELEKERTRNGNLTEEQVRKAARNGVAGLVEVASRHYPGTPEQARAAAQKAVEDYLSGNEKEAPVVVVPAP